MIRQLSDILKQTGERMLRWRGQAGGEWQGAQLKTEADREAHRTLAEGLRGLLDLPVVSEEDPASVAAPRPGRYWLIDPIDGTASLAGGFSGFVTQAALMESGVPVLAAVYAPALDRLYYAERDGGAFCNGGRIRVAGDARRRILIDNYPQPRGTAIRMMEGLECTGYLESGSISLKILRVAEGTADLFFKDVLVRDWDVAAPLLVLREAGGVMLQLNGNPWVFSGPFEKDGLLAARDMDLCRRAAGVLHPGGPGCGG